MYSEKYLDDFSTNFITNSKPKTNKFFTVSENKITERQEK